MPHHTPSRLKSDETVVPFALLGKRKGVRLVIGIAALVWGTAATCFAAVHNYPGAFACRFFVGLGGKSLGSQPRDPSSHVKRMTEEN